MQSIQLIQGLAGLRCTSENMHQTYQHRQQIHAEYGARETIKVSRRIEIVSCERIGAVNKDGEDGKIRAPSKQNVVHGASPPSLTNS